MKKVILILALVFCSTYFVEASNAKPFGPNPKDSLSIVVPNIFTPNGDGVNDTWSIIVHGYGIAIFSLRTTVYDRWGAEIFETTNIHEVWSGHNKIGKACSDGSYYYVISYINGATSELITLKGFIELIR